MMLWKIVGEACNDSGGGDMVVYAITEDGVTPPDPRKALGEAAPRYDWYRISEIRPVGDFPSAWDCYDCSPLAGIGEAIEEAERKAEQRTMNRAMVPA